MTKAKIVRALQLAEAKKWEQVKDKQRLYTLMNETDDRDQWQENQQNWYDRCVAEWYTVNELIKSLGIEQLTLNEREIAKQNNEI